MEARVLAAVEARAEGKAEGKVEATFRAQLVSPREVAEEITLQRSNAEGAVSGRSRRPLTAEG